MLVHAHAITTDAQTFTAAELERLLDWYRRLPFCHNVLPRDDELADKIALQLSRLRTRPADRPRLCVRNAALACGRAST